LNIILTSLPLYHLNILKLNIILTSLPLYHFSISVPPVTNAAVDPAPLRQRMWQELENMAHRIKELELILQSEDKKTSTPKRKASKDKQTKTSTPERKANKAQQQRSLKDLKFAYEVYLEAYLDATEGSSPSRPIPTDIHKNDEASIGVPELEYAQEVTNADSLVYDFLHTAPPSPSVVINR
jgi:hypothetical protein